jgi:hypothetical protein
MIQIPRSLARTLWAIFRRSGNRGPLRPVVSFAANQAGLRIRLHEAEVAVEYQQPGSYAAENIVLSLDTLADFEGRSDSLVALEAKGADKIQARWEDGGVPKVMDYDAAGPGVAFPASPESLASNEPGFLKALQDAMETAAHQEIRRSIHRIQLRPAGDIVATDGHQVLVQSGFSLPWTGDVFIPRVTHFGCRELPADLPVRVGLSASHVVIQVGPWTFYLSVETDCSFPTAEQVIPKPASIATRWHIAPEDATFLAKALPRLPGKADEYAPITLDLDGQAVIRSQAAGQSRPSEILLARSGVTGKPVRLCCNRAYLARALALGFSELYFVDADSAVLCRDDRRTYVWMVLDKKEAIAPASDALRIVSAEVSPATAKAAPAPNVAASDSLPSGSGNGHVQSDSPTPGKSVSPSPGTRERSSRGIPSPTRSSPSPGRQRAARRQPPSAPRWCGGRA